jgi:hypothetical protein
VIRASVFGLAVLFWAAPALAAAGFAYNERCYPTKLEAAQAMCRLGFPTLDQGNLSADSRAVNFLRNSGDLAGSYWARGAGVTVLSAETFSFNGAGSLIDQSVASQVGSSLTFCATLSGTENGLVSLVIVDLTTGFASTNNLVSLTSAEMRHCVTRVTTSESVVVRLEGTGDPITVQAKNLQVNPGSVGAPYVATGNTAQTVPISPTFDSWQRFTWCTGASSGEQLELSWSRPPATTEVVNTTLRVDFPACDTEQIEDGVEFYSIAGLGVLLFFSLMHGFSVGRVMV